MNRIDRLFGISTLLQARKYTSAENIAEQFEMSIRTVYRDIRALQEQGIPIGFEKNKGYFLIQGFFLPPVMFNTDEANALILIENLVAGFGDNSTRAHYASALTKVKAVLKTKQKENLENLNQKIRLQLPERLQFDFEYLSVIQLAISEKRIIQIDYKNAKEEASKRQIEPIGLIFYAFSWHLIAWCKLRKEYRDFKLVRIVNLHKLDAPFEKTDHMELSDYMHLLPVNY
ncbi:helix-turn-helix transcriptional regulator [Pedobacter sp. MW01-1-1]|uniref:helix-turn-helix transcriptional regulator n=1 Tax=Pedobacter sp. MW01-1-1 TaxID=3383027 RepID=UPI003FF10370